MKEQAFHSHQVASTYPKANKQAGTQQILQKYKQQTTQLQATEEEDLLQGKFETTQLMLTSKGQKTLNDATKLRAHLASHLGIKDKSHVVHGKNYNPQGDSAESILADLLEPVHEKLYEEKLQQGNDEIAQLKFKGTESIQGKFATTQLATEEQKKSTKPNNTGLPDNLKSGIENMSGYSMDDVKVYYNSDKPAQLQAHAYAQGTDIHIAPGQERHLGHEAWHVVQQKQGRVKPTMQMKGTVPVNDDAGLEKEADVMGAKAVQLAGNSVVSSEENIKQTNPSSLIQRRQIEKADKFSDLKVHDSGEKFSVVGQFGKSDASLYFDDTLHSATTKTTAIGEIAKRAGDIGKNTQALGAVEVAKGSVEEERNGIFANKDHHNNDKINAIDPFTHGSYCQIGEEDYIVLMYQHMHDFDGYVTGIEEGKIGEDKEFVRIFAKTMYYGNPNNKEKPFDKNKKVTASVVDTAEMYSNMHDKTGDAVLSTLANSEREGKADAITKLAGEGARFEWVREKIETIKDDLLYIAPARDGKPELSIQFKDLWCLWKGEFNGEYNIPNSKIDEFLYREGDKKSRIAKKRIRFNKKTYAEYSK